MTLRELLKDKALPIVIVDKNAPTRFYSVLFVGEKTLFARDSQGDERSIPLELTTWRIDEEITFYLYRQSRPKKKMYAYLVKSDPHHNSEILYSERDDGIVYHASWPSKAPIIKRAPTLDCEVEE